MLHKVCQQLRLIELPGDWIRCPRLFKSEKLFRSTCKERRQRDPDQVCDRAVGQVELRRHGDDVLGFLVRVPAHRGEACCGRHRRTLEVCCPRDSLGECGRRERSLVDTPEGVRSTKASKYSASILMDRLDQFICLVELSMVHNQSPYSFSRSHPVFVLCS